MAVNKKQEHHHNSALEETHGYGKLDSLRTVTKLVFGTGCPDHQRSSVLACDAIARDLEHFISKVK